MNTTTTIQRRVRSSNYVRKLKQQVTLDLTLKLPKSLLLRRKKSFLAAARLRSKSQAFHVNLDGVSEFLAICFPSLNLSLQNAELDSYTVECSTGVLKATILLDNMENSRLFR